MKKGKSTAKPWRRATSPTAFTLIELLIVVLIIAILAAIAIPNFMEFQVRSKIARAHSDMRTIVTALEAYCVDEGEYPAYLNGEDGPPGLYRARHYAPVRLTTPIAYLTTIPNDAFTVREAGVLPFTYFHNYDTSEKKTACARKSIFISPRRAGNPIWKPIT